MKIKIIIELKRDWAKMAKEGVEVEYIGNGIYGFCSELGTLRLLKEYRNVKQARQGYSENLKTFYFVLDI